MKRDIAENLPPSHWTRPWTRLVSVQRLLLIGVEVMDQGDRDSLRSAIATLLLSGNEAPLDVCMPKLDERAALKSSLRALREITARYGIGAKKKISPMMWLRIFQVAAIPVSKRAALSFARWQWSAFSKGQTWLMQYSNEDGDWHGTLWRHPNEPNFIRGYTFDQMLLRQELTEWLKLEWRIVLWPELDTAPRRPSIEEAEEATGSGLVAVLKQCLKRAMRRFPNDIYQREGYLESNLSRDDVVELLRGLCGEARQYAPSSIKRALPALVKCPRGRPPKRVTDR